MIGIGKTFTGLFVASSALVIGLVVARDLTDTAGTFHTADLIVDRQISNSTEVFISLGAGQHDNVDLWAGGPHTSRVEIDPSANSPTLSGIVAGNEGDLLWLWNGGFPGACAQSIVGSLCDEFALLNNSSSSSPNNRIWTADGKNLNVPNNDGVLLIYVGGFGWTVFGGATTSVRAQELSIDPSTTPAALGNGSTNDNYNPWAGTGVTSYVKQDTGLTSTVTGLSAAGAPNAEGRIVVFLNISTTGTITFTHDAGTSTPANRFLLPGAASLPIGPLGSVTFIYDLFAQRWRVLAHT